MSAKPLTITLIFQARPGKEMELNRVLTSMLAPTRREAGCINYDLHVAPDDPAKFLFYENWTSKEHHAAHDKTPHVQNLRARINELSFPPVKVFWEKVG